MCRRGLLRFFILILFYFILFYFLLYLYRRGLLRSRQAGRHVHKLCQGFCRGLQQGGGCAGLLGLLLAPQTAKFRNFKSQSPSTSICFYTTSLQTVCLSMCTCSPADTCPCCCCCTPGVWACRRLAARAASDALSAAAASASRSALSPKKPKTQTSGHCYKNYRKLL